MAFNVTDKIRIADARIGFRNFSGKEGKYNIAGKRNFCAFLETDLALRLEKDGWNVRWLEPRDEDDDRQAYLQVEVSFKKFPPKMVLISSNGQTILDETSVNILDWSENKLIDLVIRPYNWDVNGKEGVKAYVDSMYITIVEDEFEKKYFDKIVYTLNFTEPTIDKYMRIKESAIALLTFIFFTYLDYSCGDLKKWDTGRRGSIVALRIFAVLVILQLFVAGVMSGTHAGLIAPTWPKIAKDWVPGFLLRGNFSVLYDWSDYDKNPSFLLLVQFVHRSLAYVIYGFAIWMFFYFRKSSLVLLRYFSLLVGLLTVQLILGILTVINCHGKVPLFLAISHQFMGLALWLCVFYGLWRIKNANISVL